VLETPCLDFAGIRSAVDLQSLDHHASLHRVDHMACPQAEQNRPWDRQAVQDACMTPREDDTCPERDALAVADTV
jgi:hypothetical protein